MQTTYLRATVNTLIGLLAVGTIVAGATERLPVRSAANITRKPPIEMRVPPYQGQVCLIDSMICTEDEPVSAAAVLVGAAVLWHGGRESCPVIGQLTV